MPSVRDIGARGHALTTGAVLIITSASMLLALSVGNGAEAIEKDEPDRWLCVLDKAAGFAYDKNLKEWKGTTLATKEIKYIVRRSKYNDMPPSEFMAKNMNWLDNPHWNSQFPWAIAEFGQDVGAACDNIFNNFGVLFCNNGIENNYILNKSNLQFEEIYAGWGYIYQGHLSELPYKSDHPDTPHIAIGKCTPL